MARTARKAKKKATKSKPRVKKSAKQAKRRKTQATKRSRVKQISVEERVQRMRTREDERKNPTPLAMKPFSPNLELEAAIERDPRDRDAYRAYGAWLAKNGQRRFAKLVEKETEYLPAGSDDIDLYGSNELVSTFGTSIQGFMGFVRAIKLLDKKDIGPQLSQFLQLPIARFVTEFTCSFWPDIEDGKSGIVRALETWPRGHLLRIANLETMSREESAWSSSASLGDLSGLWQHLPNLECLYLSGASGDMYEDDAACDLGTLSLPKLQRFTRRASDLRREELDQILAARTPELVELGLILGEDAEIEPEHLMPVFEGRVFPKLASLSLRRTEDTLTYLEVLRRSPVLPRLMSLSLGGGDLDDSGGELLLEHGSAFRHLKRLLLSENVLSDAMTKQLDQAFGDAIFTGPQRGSPTEQVYQDAIYQEAYFADEMEDDE